MLLYPESILQSGKDIKTKKSGTEENIEEVSPMEKVESVRASDAEGVIVECVKEKGKLRIRPVSAGYHSKKPLRLP